MILRNSPDFFTELNKLIGIPFLGGGESMKGADCYGLVRMFYRRFYSVDLPDNPYEPNMHKLVIAELVDWGLNAGKWIKKDKAEPGDVVIFNLLNNPKHCGVVLENKKFLHCIENCSSCIEDLTSSVWSKRVEGFYKWTA